MVATWLWPESMTEQTTETVMASRFPSTLTRVEDIAAVAEDVLPVAVRDPPVPPEVVLPLRNLLAAAPPELFKFGITFPVKRL